MGNVSAKDETGEGDEKCRLAYADITQFLHLSSRRGRVRNKGILSVRADSPEWICSERGIRTDQWLTKTFGFPVQPRLRQQQQKKTSIAS
jgi:hypothetical protein